MRSVLIVVILTGSLLACAGKRINVLPPITMPQALAGVSVELEISDFDPRAHAVTECRVWDDWSGICLIDASPIFGTDWEMPKTQLRSATLVVGSQRVPLDVSGMFNPWFGAAPENVFNVEEAEGGYVVTGDFSDGHGSYRARWWVVDGVSIRTLVEHTCD